MHSYVNETHPVWIIIYYLISQASVSNDRKKKAVYRKRARLKGEQCKLLEA